MNSINVLLCVVFFIVSAGSKEKVRYDLVKLFNEKNVSVVHRNVTVGQENGKQCLSLSEETDEGLVWLNGVTFSTGTIEVDLKGQDVFQHSFVGIAFHGANDSTFESVYFRPFQFRTDDAARKKRGVQYISLPEHTWQVLRAEHPGTFEQPVEPGPDPNDWFHAKFEVTVREVRVFVNNASEPCLSVPLLGKRKSGMIGLYVADRSGGSFANLTIWKRDKP